MFGFSLSPLLLQCTLCGCLLFEDIVARAGVWGVACGAENAEIAVKMGGYHLQLKFYSNFSCSDNISG